MTYKITPDTAQRTMGLLAYHHNDMNAAIHDIRIGLASLGNYTDRKSEAVLDLLNWIAHRDVKFPETIQQRRDQLAQIAAQLQKGTV